MTDFSPPISYISLCKWFGYCLISLITLKLLATLSSLLFTQIYPVSLNPCLIFPTTNTPSPLCAQAALIKINVAPAESTPYKRTYFGTAWADVDYNQCSTREDILRRDLKNISYLPSSTCQVAAGVLLDPYSGKTIIFRRGKTSSAQVQIDHVVALADAWSTGAKHLSFMQRMQFANDPLNLLAVSKNTNQDKSAKNAAQWLPPNTHFHCTYIARQIAVKLRYSLWVTVPEKQAMQRVLATCPTQLLPANPSPNNSYP